MQHPWDQRLGVWWIAEDHPDAPAIVDSPSGRTLTFAELVAAAHRVANALRAQGLHEGDVVAYALPNDVDAVIWQLATNEIGLRYLTLNTALSADEFISILEHSGAAALATHADYLDRFTAVPDGTRLRIVVGDSPGIPAGFVAESDFLAGQPTTAPE